MLPVPSEMITETSLKDAGEVGAASTAPSQTSILVVGQTPPPLHGQAIMIQSFLEGTYPTFHLEHLRLNFSRSIDEVGSFSLRKLGVLASVLVGMVRARFVHKVDVLYYPPSGPKRNPILRDIVLLCGTRWLFRKTIFHFHAAGLYEFYPRLQWWEKPLFRLAYRRPDLAIFTAASTCGDAALLEAKSVAIVPCGIADEAAPYLALGTAECAQRPVILFAGILCEAKGLLVLIEACALLRKAGHSFELVCMGDFDSKAFQLEVEELVDANDLGCVVHFPGVLTGSAKLEVYASCSIFCFPSHYHSESSPIVLLEAMSFAKPIVASLWRGIPETVGQDGGAVLVPPRDPAQLAAWLEELLGSPELRHEMGLRNRRRFLQHFTVEQYRGNMERALKQVVGGDSGCEGETADDSRERFAGAFADALEVRVALHLGLERRLVEVADTGERGDFAGRYADVEPPDLPTALCSSLPPPPPR
jgi:glycosyltransferase involved in cell wall biosynthesis